jgi:hypothetical protein
VKIDDINRALMPAVQKVNAKRQIVESLQQRVASEKDPKARGALLDQLEGARRELRGEAEGLAALGQDFGLFADDGLGHDDLARGLGSTGRLMEGQNDLAGLRGGFGHEVTDAQTRAVVGQKVGNATEGAAVIAARRQKDIDAIVRHVADGGKTGLSGEQQKAWDFWTNLARSQPNTFGMNDAQARRAGLAMMQANVTNVDPGVAGSVVVGDEGEARALVRTRRRMLPYRASAADVEGVLNVNKGTMTADEAAGLANARLRARRLGVDEDEVRGIMAARGFSGAQGEMDAIGEAFASRAAARYAVTDQDRAAFRAAHPDVPAGADVDALILGRRAAADKERFSKFWGGEEGQAFRESVENAGSDVETVADRLTRGPQMTRRLGTRAVTMAEGLRSDQQRLRELALHHAGGDVARLLAGDLTTDATTRAGADAAAAVRTEVAAIQRRQRGTLAELAGAEGARGRQFELGDYGAARTRVIDEAVRAGRLTPEQGAAMKRADLSPMLRAQLASRSRELGSEDQAKLFLGIDPGATNLSEYQLAKVNAVRHGAGSDEAAIGVFGRDRYDALSPNDKTRVLSSLKAGTGGDRTAAMQMLGVTEAQVAADPELAERVAAVAAGVGSDGHLRLLTGGDPTKMRAAKAGLSSESWAREVMGLGADPVPADIQAKIAAVREAMGNEAEADRLLAATGGGAGGALGGVAGQEAARAKLSRNLSLLRRISPEQEALLMRHSKGSDRLQTLADKHRTTVAGLSTAKLSKSESELYRKLSADQAASDADVQALAKTLGVSPDELIGSTGALKTLDRAYAAYAKKAEMSPAALAKAVLSEYGFQTGDQAGRTEQQLAEQMSSVKGRAMGRRVLESAQALKSVAARGGKPGAGGVSDMMAEYAETARSGDAARMAEFQRKYGFGSDPAGQAEFARFQRDASFQQQTGLLKVGREGKLNREDDLLRMYSMATRAGEKTGAGPDGRGGEPQRITGRLEIQLKSDGTGFGDLSGAYGGGLDYTAPGGS